MLSAACLCVLRFVFRVSVAKHSGYGSLSCAVISVAGSPPAAS
jgi:hypothetical protein